MRYTNYSGIKVIVAMLLGAVVWVGCTGSASQNEATTVKTDGAKSAMPTPHLADGHPDLSGLWGRLFANFVLTKNGNSVSADLVGNTYGKDVKYDPKDPDRVLARLKQFVGDETGHAQRQASYKKNPNLMPPYKPELLAKVQELDEKGNRLDPAFFCRPSGIPRMGPPLKIVQSPGTAVFFYAGAKSGNFFRTIPTDGRPHRTNIDPTYWGDSVGHWEGDTLVVDATNFTDDTWLGPDGWFHSTKLHVVERLQRNGDTITYQVTVEDPEVLTKPWVRDPVTLKLNTNPDDELFELAPCVEVDSEHLVNYDR